MTTTATSAGVSADAIAPGMKKRLCHEMLSAVLKPLDRSVHKTGGKWDLSQLSRLIDFEIPHASEP